MITSHKVINDLINQALITLSKFSPIVHTEADNEQVYDVRIVLSRSAKSGKPRLIALSHDREVGYFIDIDNVTWEFNDNQIDFQKAATELLRSIKDGKVRMVKKKILGFIVIGENIEIQE